MSVNGPLGATSQGGAFEFRSPTRVGSTARTSRRGLVGLFGVLSMGTLLCLAATRTLTLLPESVRPVPAGLAGPLQHVGINLTGGEVCAALVLMFGGYVLAVRFADQVSPRVMLFSIAALTAIVLLAPPLLSTDLFSYQAYARMFVNYGANPYLSGPKVIGLDPVYHFIDAKWIGTPSAYGPLFTLMSGVLANASIAASALWFKAVAAVSSLGIIALIWQSAKLRGLDPVRGVALFGLNPLVVLYGVGGGHNDLLMLLLTTGGIYSLLTHRDRTSGALIALGTGIKLTGGLLLPFALASGVHLGAEKRRRAILIGAGSAGAVIAVAGVAVFGAGPLHLPGTLDRIQSEGDWKSIPGFINAGLGLPSLSHLTGLVLGAAFAAVCVVLLRRVWHGHLDWIDGAAWATVALLVTASSLLPWYVAWLMPLVALCTDRRLLRVSLWLTGVMLAITMVAYIPHGDTYLPQIHAFLGI